MPVPTPIRPSALPVLAVDCPDRAAMEPMHRPAQMHVAHGQILLALCLRSFAHCDQTCV